MTSNGPTTGQDGFFHQAGVYRSDQEMVRMVATHLQGAVAAGEPAVAVLQDDQMAMLRATMDGDSSAVTFLPALSAQARPPAVIAMFRSLGDLVERGAARVRVVSTMPHPGLGAPWDGWSRCEAAINEALRHVPIWGLCLYDARITPDAVLHDVAHTHPHLTTGDGQHQPNDSYLDPATFLTTMPEPPLDPLEAEPPDIELDDPTAATARSAVQTLASGTSLSSEEVTDLVVATSEAVTNARLHGGPPVRMRAWAASDRVVVAVSDAGEGPHDPYAGLVVPDRAAQGGGGYGLWLMHQLAAAVFSTHENDGFTVHLVGGRAVPLYHPQSPGG